MKQTIILSKEDIEHILAKYFKVEQDEVNLFLSPVYKGYGIGKNKDVIIKAEIETKVSV